MKTIAMIVILGLATVPAWGTKIENQTYTFQCIDNSNPACNNVASQFRLDTSYDNSDTGIVQFQFVNSGLAQTTITALYWAENPLGLLDGMTIGDTEGIVSFQIAPNPLRPPGGQTLLPPWKNDDTTHMATSVNRGGNGIQSGIGPLESQIVEFSLGGGHTFNDLIGAMNAGALGVLGLGGGEPGDSLRVAIFVQSTGPSSGYSGSLILSGLSADPPPDVPEPGSALLLLVGTAVLLAAKARRARKA